ncbi:TIGR02679 family protein [Streptomyces sp. Tu10]|uniref:TIGR02679 family protein n=1 Tax=Streptomyces sp. Tu10 TaxID=2838018 RepID=UPI001BDC3BFA|nr:TIGR02679 family protein [Streptomyces sp. Tu10]MBT1105650.1 TIGR02679 family protein [Streptomyces sp. Tu10]
MTTPTPATRLNRPALRPVWQTIHDRLSSGRPVARVRLGPLDDEQREALADLMGWDRLPDTHPTLTLTHLQAALAETSPLTLTEILTHIIGPLHDRAGDRHRRNNERAALWEWLDNHPTIHAQPALLAWTAHCRTTGLIDNSTTRTRALLTSALTVLSALPASGEPLPHFAARLVHGNSHALDDGTRLSTLTLRALATLYDQDPPESAQQRRALWTRAGVADDGLSTTVLAAGLRPTGSGLLSQLTTLSTEAGHATSLTLAQLRTPEDFGLPDGHVHITENPTIMAMALNRFGRRCPALVCTSGWPNSAAIHLLRLLAEKGATLHYHGDFDGEGIRIAAHVMDKTSAMPWQMAATNYLDALSLNPRGPSIGRLTPVPWDPALTTAMTEHGTAVLEETVASALLDDLAR